MGTGYIAGLACSLALLGCHAPSAEGEAMSWEAFKRAATRDIDGRQVYIVEWDQAVTEEELRERYEAYVAHAESGHVGLAESEQESIVNQVGGIDDIWRNNQQLNLTYCVSNAFGATKARAVLEMAQAAAAWEAVARVNFIYLPVHDANCNNGNPNVVFSVAPWTSGGACAFFPSGGGCVPRTVVIDFVDLDNNYGTIAPNVRTVGVFRHELGHVLGLRHEHTRPESGVCFENSAWRALTPYDRSSVMHYPWCNGVTASDLSITPADALGAVALYGLGSGNLAAGKPASQSSTYAGTAAASRAVDGNTDGNWASNSVSHTNFEAAPWWQVDLGAVTSLAEVVLHNRTDCCGTRLSNFDIQVSSDGVTWSNAAYFPGTAGARTAIALSATGRYVRVRLRGTEYLQLAEVEVFARSNLAAGRPASQSSTYEGTALASRAVDGNVQGNWSFGSVTHTNFEAQPWWQVDLGSIRSLGSVVLYNRTDCCGTRLAELDIQVSNDGVNWAVASSYSGPAATRTGIPLATSARYVRVRLRGTDFLSLAEVQVFGP